MCAYATSIIIVSDRKRNSKVQFPFIAWNVWFETVPLHNGLFISNSLQWRQTCIFNIHATGETKKRLKYSKVCQTEYYIMFLRQGKGTIVNRKCHSTNGGWSRLQVLTKTWNFFIKICSPILLVLAPLLLLLERESADR